MIVDSLQRDGFGRSILIDENDTVLAGNATIDAAAEAGIERVRIIEAAGHEISVGSIPTSGTSFLHRLTARTLVSTLNLAFSFAAASRRSWTLPML